jgi:hypothetical protein
MKINIWIKREEAITGNINGFYTTEPVANLKDPDNYKTEYVQVQVSQDEFAALEDSEHDKWIVEQYNRNRLVADQITNINEINE